MILGSGLGVLAEQMTGCGHDQLHELPGFPISTVHGHAGELVLGTLAGVPVVCMKGRGHFYEGYGLGVMTSAVRTMKLLGCEMLFVTNAAGSLRPEVDAGSLVALTDHINCCRARRWSARTTTASARASSAWPTPTTAELRALVKAGRKGHHHARRRVHRLPGPELRDRRRNPHDGRSGRRRGRHVGGAGSRVGAPLRPEGDGVSVITNLAEGMSPFPLSHEQTLKYAAIGAKDLVTLILAFLESLALKTPRASLIYPTVFPPARE
jgi:xanthosine phosphorylase